MANPLDIKSIMSSAIKRLAAKYNVKPTELVVRLFLSQETSLLTYQLLIKGSPVKNPDREDGFLSFNKDILHVKIDLLSREIALNQFVMPPVLEKLSNETRASAFELSIMVGTLNDETCNAYLFLYKGTEPVRQLFIEKDF
jgi:hypothetical protein